MGNLPRLGRLLLMVVGTAGLGLLLWTAAGIRWQWQALFSLVLFTGTDAFRVQLRRYKEESVSITLDVVGVFFMLGLFGPHWALLTAMVHCTAFALFNRSPFYKFAYNAGASMLACTTAILVLTTASLPWLVALPLAAISNVIVNTGAIALIVAIASGRPAWQVWRENHAWMTLQHVALAAAGFVLGVLVEQAGWYALLVALPLPIVHYTYTLYAGATRRHTQELEELSTELITTLAAVVDARDAYTFGHSTQVAAYSVAIAQQLGYSQEDLTRLHRSALLHDIGKVGIPERILFKPGRLTPEEFELMKRHTTIGHDIIKRIQPLKEAATVALHHHERWNGKGYPLGLVGQATGLDSRIVGVADTLETLISDRPYRRGCPLTDALAEIDRCSGVLFDPMVVRALHRVVADKGAGFFVNSAAMVKSDGATIVQWSPADLGTRVAVARE